jgi:hypothetical protein
VAILVLLGGMLVEARFGILGKCPTKASQKRLIERTIASPNGPLARCGGAWSPRRGWSGHDERMDVEVVEALEDDRTVIRRLLQLYHYDFSEFDGSDVNLHGEYLHRYFDEYWTNADRKAFLNPAATAFWRKAIRYPFQEHERGTEIVQSFTADRDG